MPSFETIDFTLSDHVGIIRLNRPDSANGIDCQLARELNDCARFCHENDEIRAVLLTANGRMFSAGGDLKSFAAAGAEMVDMISTLIDDMHQAIARLDSMQKPLIIAVNGMAAGAGFSIACIGDIVYAADTAKFTMAYSAAGLTPDAAGSYYLPRLIGLRKTQALLLNNTLLTAEQALDMGIITGIHPSDTLFDEALKTAQSLAKGPTQAYGKIKTLLASSSQHSLSEHMAMESTCMLNSLKTSDGQEGIQAFLDKRRPVFTGK